MALSMPTLSYFFLEPRYSFLVVQPGDQLKLIWFAIESTFMIMLIRSAEIANVKAAKTRIELEIGNLERRRSEVELRGKENLLRLITGSMPMAVAYLDADLRYLFCNEVYAKWLGRNRGDIIGRLARDVVQD